MELNEEQLTQFRENPKTQFLARQFDDLSKQQADAVALTNEDPALGELAAEEVRSLNEQRAALFTEMEKIVKEAKQEEERPYGVVLEVRAGAGGDEAALFAEELARMYLRYAERNNWGYTMEHESRAASGGYKEAAFEILSSKVYDALR